MYSIDDHLKGKDNMKTVFWLLVICALCVAYWSFFVLDSGRNISGVPETHHREDFPGDKAYRVEKVIDGDTIRIDYNGQSERVRLIGVDTPEMDNSDKKLRALAKRATKYTEKLLGKRSVYLRFDQDRRDRYNRLLAYVYRASDGLFVNLELVREGYANAFVKYPFEHKDLFQHHEAQARKARKGIWR